jgi:hypothetical protein
VRVYSSEKSSEVGRSVHYGGKYCGPVRFPRVVCVVYGRVVNISPLTTPTLEKCVVLQYDYYGKRRCRHLTATTATTSAPTSRLLPVLQIRSNTTPMLECVAATLRSNSPRHVWDDLVPSVPGGL